MLSDPYLDRVCPAADTVERVRPFFAQFGITRVAKQTSLDDLGIHCFASFRPASRTLATNQGKGLTEDAAKASAIMEALEFAVAECPDVETYRATIDQMELEGRPVFWPYQLLSPATTVASDRAISWASATGLFTNDLFWVPLEAVSLGSSVKDFPGICQTTNGLASGNTREEAVFHAICELIERDAYTFWTTLSPSMQARRRLFPEAFCDPALDGLVKQIREAGKVVVLFDQTTDIGMPVVMAVITDFSQGARRFDMAAGYGAHPSAQRAAIRAVTEAAQTRVTSIAASRDDIAPQHYSEWAEEAWVTLVTANATIIRPVPPSLGQADTLTGLLQIAHSALRQASVSEPIVVDLDGGNLPFSVVRLLSSDLEDFEANLNWRPGFRASKWLMP